jgi:hypothetical protein
MLIEIRDNVIWARHVAGDPRLHDALLGLSQNETIRMKVDGIVGTWCKMRDGRDGRPTPGIKPVGAMATVWERMQARRGEMVAVEWADADPDPVLVLADAGFDEWYSAEDEEAFGALQPV